MTLVPTTRRPGPRTRAAAAAHLTDDQIDELGRELDAIHAEVLASLGDADARYIRGVITVQRVLEASGRGCLLFARNPIALAGGVGMLSVAKILENMEIGHNVIHGQWDWMRDPDIHSTTWEWDIVAPASAWKHTHNNLHHTWTNVVGRDDDVGYDLLRVTKRQPWSVKAAFNVPLNMILAPLFEWGVAIYGLELPERAKGNKPPEAFRRDLREFLTKAARQLGKDYAATPVIAQLVSGSGLASLAGTAAANLARNLWTHAIIFCGHFPDGVETFDEASVEGESRGEWYLRQIAGSANIDGGPLLHLMSGNLSFQIEHHLFPDMPSNRYAEVAPRVRALCEKYGLPYVSGSFPVQVAKTWRSIAKLSIPDSLADGVRKRLGRRRAPRAPQAAVAR